MCALAFRPGWLHAVHLLLGSIEKFLFRATPGDALVRIQSNRATAFEERARRFWKVHAQDVYEGDLVKHICRVLPGHVQEVLSQDQPSAMPHALRAGGSWRTEAFNHVGTRSRFDRRDPRFAITAAAMLSFPGPLGRTRPIDQFAAGLRFDPFWAAGTEQRPSAEATKASGSSTFVLLVLLKQLRGLSCWGFNLRHGGYKK
eukprot:1094126-Rhodomonas_salina.2